MILYRSIIAPSKEVMICPLIPRGYLIKYRLFMAPSRFYIYILVPWWPLHRPYIAPSSLLLEIYITLYLLWWPLHRSSIAPSSLLHRPYIAPSSLLLQIYITLYFDGPYFATPSPLHRSYMAPPYMKWWDKRTLKLVDCWNWMSKILMHKSKLNWNKFVAKLLKNRILFKNILF